MEKYVRNARFCLICNYLSNIIPALQSRCTRFRFQPLPEQFVRTRLDYICKEEEYVVKKYFFIPLLRQHFFPSKYAPVIVIYINLTRFRSFYFQQQQDQGLGWRCWRTNRSRRRWHETYLKLAAVNFYVFEWDISVSCLCMCWKTIAGRDRRVCCVVA